MDEITTTHLTYNPLTGLIYLRANDEGDDIPIGTVSDVFIYLLEYRDEYQQIVQEVRDQERYAMACERTAELAYWRAKGR